MVRIDHESLEFRRKWFDFIAREEIYPIRGYGYGDPNTSIHFYLPKDAEKVVKFLREQGVTESNNGG